MTTGRINQVAALSPNGRGLRTAAGRITVLSPEGEGASYAKVSIAMPRADHPAPRERSEGGRRLFLESPLSVPPPNSNESEANPAWRL